MVGLVLLIVLGAVSLLKRIGSQKRFIPLGTQIALLALTPVSLINSSHYQLQRTNLMLLFLASQLNFVFACKEEL